MDKELSEYKTTKQNKKLFMIFIEVFGRLRNNSIILGGKQPVGEKEIDVVEFLSVPDQNRTFKDVTRLHGDSPSPNI